LAFSAEAFQRQLTTARFGRACRVVPEAGSTIDLAWKWLRAGGPEGGVVIADRQTQARGRLGRPWAAPEGGLWMSALARPDIPAHRGGRLGVLVALATAEGVSVETGCSATLRWPNDVLIQGRKVGGVLIDAQINMDRVGAAVLSLGINVNTPSEALPPELHETATSLLSETGRCWSLEALAARILGNLERDWPLLLAEAPGLAARWRELDAILAAEVCVEIGSSRAQGLNQGIDEEGALMVKTVDGTRRITSGEVRFLRPTTG
jgi:BirA family biotin operon repressor/biotin-[acetyl-CoA-carboxylase] ligase